MDRAKMEIAAIEKAVKEAADAAQEQLNELQLTFSGGGAADPIFF